MPPRVYDTRIENKKEDAIMHYSWNVNQKRGLNQSFKFNDVLLRVTVGTGSTWQRARMYRLA